MRGKTPVLPANISPFSLDLQGFNHFLPYFHSIPGVLSLIKIQSVQGWQKLHLGVAGLDWYWESFPPVLSYCSKSPSQTLFPIHTAEQLRQDPMSYPYLSLGDANENIGEKSEDSNLAVIPLGVHKSILANIQSSRVLLKNFMGIAG